MDEPFDLVVRNGRVITATDSWNGDIGVREGRIAALAEKLGTGREEIDAKGRLVLPGGIDSHCHIDQVTSTGVRSADDFYSGTVSAAFGGTTTIIPFAAQQKGNSLHTVVEDYHARATGKAVVDYAFHLIVSDATEQVVQEELPRLIADGYTSLKVYMTYEALRLSDRQILDVLSVARQRGALVMVHCESHDLIGWMTDRLLAAGNTAPRYHAVAGTVVAEREATHRAISMAELVDVPIMIVHVSSSAAADQIRWAQGQGLSIHAETCPQYLFLTADDLDQPDFDGAKYCCSPPLRDTANQEALWRNLKNGTLQVLSSDHSAFRFDDEGGKKAFGSQAPFHRIPKGLPGLEVRLPLVFSEVLTAGRLSLNEFVAATATNPARLYGLFPRKGTIAVGSDADLVIWNPEAQVRITLEAMHDNMDYTPYEGRVVHGWPEVTLCRGRVVCQDGNLIAEAGYGTFLPCGRPEPLRNLRAESTGPEAG